MVQIMLMSVSACELLFTPFSQKSTVSMINNKSQQAEQNIHKLCVYSSCLELWYLCTCSINFLPFQLPNSFRVVAIRTTQNNKLMLFISLHITSGNSRHLQCVLVLLMYIYCNDIICMIMIFLLMRGVYRYFMWNPVYTL